MSTSVLGNNSLIRLSASFALWIVLGLLCVTEAVAETYEVRRGDTMSGIAASLKGDNATGVTTIMYSLHAANPHAFIDGDINKLKAGVILEIPESFTVTQRSAAPAAPKPAAAPISAAPPPTGSTAKVTTTTANVSAPPSIGETVFARGAVTAQAPGASPRLIGKKAPIYAGDILTTAKRSIAVVKLTDGTRIALRPNTVFTVEQYNAEPEQETNIMRLFKGGLRSITGYVSKRNPRATKLRTSVATIGIRGTEFDARLCDEDCAQEASQVRIPAGRVGFVRGLVHARSPAGPQRVMKVSARIFPGDTIITDAKAFTVLVFRDKSRVTVLPGTEFRVDELEFVEAEPSRDRAVFTLLRGGLRAVTGFIGKRTRKSYRMNTPVATIGIRGTAYDLLCQGNCVNDGGEVDPSGDGMFAGVSNGSIEGNGYVINAGAANFFGNAAMAPVTVASVPLPPNIPPPDQVEIPTLLETTDPKPEPGLYVGCYVGNCDVETDENVTPLQDGQGSYVNKTGGPAQPAGAIQAFQSQDTYLQAIDPAFQTLFNLYNQDGSAGGFQCLIN